MAMMDKFLNMMRLNSEEEDDFYDDDYYDEEDDYYEEPKRKSFRREKEKEEDTTARFATTKESKSAVKSNSKVTPMRQVKKNQGGNAAMEVCVIKPTSVEDAREITETLLNNRTVVLNLEGLDLEIGQRIIDFTSEFLFCNRWKSSENFKFYFYCNTCCCRYFRRFPEYYGCI